MLQTVIVEELECFQQTKAIPALWFCLFILCAKCFSLYNCSVR